MSWQFTVRLKSYLLNRTNVRVHAHQCLMRYQAMYPVCALSAIWLWGLACT